MEISNNISLADISSENLKFKNIKEKDRFDEFMENEDKKKAEQKQTKKLLEDLDSVAKTGFTKDELEAIRKKLEELQQKRAQSGYNSQRLKEALENQKADLVQAIYEVTGKKVNLSENSFESFIQEQNKDGFQSISTNESLKLLAKTKR